MPAWHSGWRAVAAAVLSAAAAFAAGLCDRAHAQSPGARAAEELLYEIHLDLSLNPTRTDEAEPLTRIVHGLKADSGEWPSAVSLSILKEGASIGTLCGGTVIDARWILTAAHCVFDRHRGGVKSLLAVTAYTRSSIAHQGEPRRVAFVTVHRMFAVVPRPGKKSPGLVNDIALLELEAPTTAPRQKLLADAGQRAVLGSGALATVVGWGLTHPRRPDERSDPAQHSKVLLKADIPFASRAACDAFLAFAGGVPTQSVLCAGDGRGGADTCNGDSGGPIFVPGPNGEPLQAGIVSWGDGCAHPGTYGAYTAVAQFEPWIRERVPHAQWVAPQSGAQIVAASPEAAAGRPRLPGAEARPLPLRIVGLPAPQRQRIAAALTDVSLAGEADVASLVWDAPRQLVLDERGQRIAEGVDAGRLQHAVDRRRALDRLTAMSARSGLDMKIRSSGAAPEASPGGSPDAMYKAGSRLQIDVGGVNDGAYVAVFNLAGNGLVELIEPASAREGCPEPACTSGTRWSTGGTARPLEVEVRAPFGADHVTAVAGALPLTRLMPALAKAHGTFAVAEVMAALAAEQRTQPLQVGIRGLYSTRE